MDIDAIDVALAIELIVVAARYAGSTADNTENCFAALEWQDERKKPTWDELLIVWGALQYTHAQKDIEVEWVQSEMPIAQKNVTAIEYGEEDIPGTAQQWQKYWLALRKWTADNPDFPDISKRPVQPS